MAINVFFLGYKLVFKNVNVDFERNFIFNLEMQNKENRVQRVYAVYVVRTAYTVELVSSLKSKNYILEIKIWSQLKETVGVI